MGVYSGEASRHGSSLLHPGEGDPPWNELEVLDGLVLGDCTGRFVPQDTFNNLLLLVAKLVARTPLGEYIFFGDAKRFPRFRDGTRVPSPLGKCRLQTR